ncbi:Uncharacterized protein TCM_016892 [Theobroma cacao]|uniref:Uncharacterized protein n=1 Tax=Theobroma cacao TaxID=3641 RepID=A0A061ECM4_THECC|nr:Uncharacterized protein TCM_016892 [Theobroma cacao]
MSISPSLPLLFLFELDRMINPLKLQLQYYEFDSKPTPLFLGKKKKENLALTSHSSWQMKCTDKRFRYNENEFNLDELVSRYGSPDMASNKEKDEQ